VVADKKDYDESGTKEYDKLAFKYLGMAFFPLAVCYCIYRCFFVRDGLIGPNSLLSVIYNEHKSWYSFILNSCYGFLLTFGFIMMTPQVLNII
jgi:hypothetical protein